jgi:hypothetical protein
VEPEALPGEAYWLGATLEVCSRRYKQHEIRHSQLPNSLAFPPYADIRLVYTSDVRSHKDVYVNAVDLLDLLSLT